MGAWAAALAALEEDTIQRLHALEQMQVGPRPTLRSAQRRAPRARLARV
jgi:hypothetical protein